MDTTRVSVRARDQRVAGVLAALPPAGEDGLGGLAAYMLVERARSVVEVGPDIASESLMLAPQDDGTHDTSQTPPTELKVATGVLGLTASSTNS